MERFCVENKVRLGRVKPLGSLPRSWKNIFSCDYKGKTDQLSQDLCHQEFTNNIATRLFFHLNVKDSHECASTIENSYDVQFAVKGNQGHTCVSCHHLNIINFATNINNSNITHTIIIITNICTFSST